MEHKSLEGVRVLDLTSGWSGPIGARFLGDLGAEVIKIESLTGRGIGWVTEQPNPKEYSKICHATYPNNDPSDQPYNRYGAFNEYNRNKMSLTLNLTREDCKEVFRTLVSISDIVIENYSSRVMANFGFGYPALRTINPTILFISMPGFGMTGPHKNHVSYGTNIEPTAGASNMIGYPGSMPYKSGEALPDPNAGLHAVGALLTALLYRRRTGVGQFIDLSQNEAFIGLIGEALLAYEMNKEEPVRMGNRHPYFAPHNTYKCKGQDCWVGIAVTNDKEWNSLCDVMGNPTWTKKNEFGDQLSRWKNQDELDENISSWTANKNYKKLMHELQSNGIRAAAVYTNQDVVEDMHLNERGYFWEIDQAATGPMIFSGVPVQLSKTPGNLFKPAPMMGEHNNLVLQDIVGLTDQQVRALESARAIATKPPDQ